MISKHPDWETFRDAPIKGNAFRKWLKTRFRYVDYPFVLTYRGYGNADRFTLQGHVFRGMAKHNLERKQTIWKNFIYLLKMFMVRTQAKVPVILSGEGISTQRAETDENGLYTFEVKKHELQEGWNHFQVHLDEKLAEGQESVHAGAQVLIRNEFEYGVISDIDDTLLISHVTQPLKKFYLLMTKNALSRKPVKGVVRFYRALCKGVDKKANPFFYVSSSEWNLYDFLLRFMEHNDFPKGVLQLKEIKDSWKDFLRSGYGSHDHKRIKIEGILSHFPDRKFILIGDNGQQDANIYLDIAHKYTEQIKAIYIRQATSSNTKKVDELLEQIRAHDIPFLQFQHTAEALEHAKEYGFLK
jgi:phosphatidate phosphatase APP1